MGLFDFRSDKKVGGLPAVIFLCWDGYIGPEAQLERAERKNRTLLCAR